MADEYIKKSDAEEYLSQPITMSTCLSVEECKTRRRQKEVDLLLLRSIPAADVAPVRHGRWERHFSRPCVYADLLWHCSVCGYKNAESFADAYHHYCPNCGAKMEKEEE